MACERGGGLLTNSPFAVEMNDIVKKFGEVVASNHVDFLVEKGEIHALLGENGNRIFERCRKAGIFHVCFCTDLLRNVRPSDGSSAIDERQEYHRRL